MNKIKLFLPLILMSSLVTKVCAQDDLLSQVQSNDNQKAYTMASFKSTRLINFQTLEVVGKRSLDFRISHRFGEIGNGAEGFYGIDGPASIRLGLEYSHDGRLMAGIGRTSYQKMIDGFLKYRWIRQTEDSKTPISVTLVSSIFVQTGKDPEAEISGMDKYKYFSNRLSYCHQVIIGRKFNQRLSLQLAPAIVHFNMAETFTDNNDSFHMTGAARYKVSHRIALTAEYGYTLKTNTQKDVYNPLGLGIDIETGGHVFQLFVTNSFGIVENQFLPYTNSSWVDKGIRVGFNVSRVFSL